MKNETPNAAPVNYTVPQISKANPQDWFIFFEYTHDGVVHRLKKREGLNRIKDLRQRKIEAEQLAQARHDWLKMGWNPVADPEFNLRRIIAPHGKTEMHLNDALDFALSKKSLKKKTKQCYESNLEFIKGVALKTGHSLQISQLDRWACLGLMDECAKERNFSNHNYNSLT